MILKGEPKYSERYLSEYHFTRKEFHMGCPEMERGVSG
jgi:hypothetical protein